MTEENKIIDRMSRIGIIGNILLSAFKLMAGAVGKSGAMVSDAVHSLSDVFATLIALIGVRLSGRKPDEEHQYGHERFECIAELVLGGILAATGIGIGYSGIKMIVTKGYASMDIPTALPLIAAVVSIVSKEALFRYTVYYAKKLKSSAFEADAWHHRSDALSSIGSFAGILGARLGARILEPVASLVICAFILKVAYDILKNGLVKLLDTSCGEDFEEELCRFIKGHEGVGNVDMLRTRMFGSKVYVDLEISVERHISLVGAHDIAEAVHNDIEKEYPDVKHVMIHVNPGEG